MSLLTERIKKHNIPKWPYQPAFDRVIVYALPAQAETRKTFIDGGLIEKTDETRSRQKSGSARGVLLAAGLTAMDHLRGHGIELGHYVWTARLSPWQHTVDISEKGAVELLFLRSSDIVGSEDTLDQQLDGKLLIDCDDKTGQHAFVFEGVNVPRFDPPEHWE